MARRLSGSDPDFRPHKPTGRALVSLPHGDGTIQDIDLAVSDGEERRPEYARVIAEWNAPRIRADRLRTQVRTAEKPYAPGTTPSVARRAGSPSSPSPAERTGRWRVVRRCGPDSRLLKVHGGQRSHPRPGRSGRVS